ACIAVEHVAGAPAIAPHDPECVGVALAWTVARVDEAPGWPGGVVGRRRRVDGGSGGAPEQGQRGDPRKKSVPRRRASPPLPAASPQGARNAHGGMFHPGYYAAPLL